MSKVNANCSVCGKEILVDENLIKWSEATGNALKCNDCFKKSSTAKKAPAKTSGTTTTAKTPKAEVSAAMFRKAYDELVAEFSDIKEEVAPYLGGWASTVVINRSR